jgi:hypothetical protein
MRALILIIALLAAPSLQAADVLSTAATQTIYLPVYSHVYHGERDKNGKPSETLVSTHVSIRNTDPATPIRIQFARYFDTQGKLVRNYVTTPITIPPFGTHEIFIPRSDTAGGSGANFLFAWNSDSPANTPLIEALHADIREARTLMFITSGTPIRALDPAP